MRDKIFMYSKDRSFILNLVICILCFVSMFLVPSLVAIVLLNVVNETIGALIGDAVLILLLCIVFYKDLVKEAKLYFKDFKSNFKKSFKIYILGFMGMVFFNLIIVSFLKDISSNESQVREMLYNNVITSLINICIMAPIVEELIFRKSIAPVFKNKWLYILTSALLFGGAHILTNFVQGIFTISDLLYILPYGCLGGSFALMDYNNKSIFPSIIIHSMHNTFTAILLLVTYFGGK